MIVVTSTIPALTNQNQLTVNYTVDGGAVQTHSFTLVEGDNTGLVITGTDVFGNQGTFTLPMVRLDTTAPVIAVTSTIPELTNVRTLTVTYTVDGEAQTPIEVALTEGDNEIVIPYREDEAGNITLARTFHVTLDTQAVIVIDPSTSTLISKRTLTVSYTVDGVEKIRVFGDTELAEGLNHLSITDTDLAGNSANATFDVTVDTSPLSLSRTSLLDVYYPPPAPPQPSSISAPVIPASIFNSGESAFEDNSYVSPASENSSLNDYLSDIGEQEDQNLLVASLLMQGMAVQKGKGQESNEVKKRQLSSFISIQLLLQGIIGKDASEGDVFQYNPVTGLIRKPKLKKRRAKKGEFMSFPIIKNKVDPLLHSKSQKDSLRKDGEASRTVSLPGPATASQERLSE